MLIKKKQNKDLYTQFFIRKYFWKDIQILKMATSKENWVAGMQRTEVDFLQL